MKIIFTVFVIFFSTTFAFADRTDEVRILKDVLAELEESSPELFTTIEGKRFRFLFNLIEEAHAGEKSCFYAGWPSEKIKENGKSYCTSPKNIPGNYPAGACGENKLLCQPLLFGKDLCVSTLTREDRVNAFKNCEKKFRDEDRNYDHLANLSRDEHEQLNEIGALAQNLCQTTKKAGAMCRKVLERIEDSAADLGKKKIAGNENHNKPVRNNEFLPDIVINEDKEDKNKKKELEEPHVIAPPLPAEPSQECLDKIQDDLAKIADLASDIASIMSVKEEQTTWNKSNVGKANQVVDLQEEVLCLEMEIFVLHNQLDFKVDCSSKPKKLPPMHMELVKYSGQESVYDIAQDRINSRAQSLRDYVALHSGKVGAGLYDNVPNTKREWIDKINKRQVEIECLENFRERKKCLHSESDKMSSVADYLNASGGSPKVTMFVDLGGKLLPFKTFDKLQIRGGLGPKIYEGDNMTPEGTFRVARRDGGETNTNYFSAAHIRYEDWGQERQRMLSALPVTDRNPGRKGGSILIHGFGGSIGCLSFSNSESAYFAALSRNKGKNNEPLRISIYPGEMSQSFIESSSDVPEFRKYKDFWEKLKVTQDKERGRTDDSRPTINQIYDEY